MEDFRVHLLLGVLIGVMRFKRISASLVSVYLTVYPRSRPIPVSNISAAEMRTGTGRIMF